MSALRAAVALAAIAPGREEAREWAHRELSSDPDYRDSDVTFFERIGAAIRALFSSLGEAVGGIESPWLVLVLLAAIAGLAVLIVLRVRRGTGSALDPALFERPALARGADPDRLRAASAAAWARGELGLAVQERARTVFAVLARRGELTVGPASTAAELSAAAAARLPAHAASLRAAGELFDAVTFGEHAATPADYEALVALDAAVSARSGTAPGAVAEAPAAGTAAAVAR
ncbi:DUF4129 domain-containing protein [Brevibacterium sp. 5221]|uniref:DUF4129 domain-containing protein n=1 Tax=Brevibacterium rongguiense TaxID=2695267 RepID=A0A6N9HA29_9MICO|nr:DUF4129 domain-containing protein [Brevibacterium rongguiense]MYM20879.1 DUF4129 domain-containing protein [Brevibacterium rongguiense]